MNIASEFERIFAGKADIVSAIEEKGVEVPQGTRINEMATYVRSIQTGGGAQADWNAAEGEAGHILNRTHYVTKDEVTVLPEFTVTPDSDGDVELTELYEYYPKAGETCIVEYNGTTYTCVVWETDLMGFPMSFIGNASAIAGGGDTGEPFTVGFVPEDKFAITGVYTLIMVTDGAASITMSVKGQKEAFHKLDDRFIHTPDWNAAADENGHVLNRTHYVEAKWLVKDVSFTTEQIENLEAYTIVSEMPVAGETYFLTLNGKTKECVFETGSSGYISYTDPETINTILFMNSGGMSIMMYSAIGDKSDVTLSIRSADIIHPLDKKFIPAHADKHTWKEALTWDGDLTGHVVYDAYDDGTELWCRVSDVVPTMDDLANGYRIEGHDNNTGKDQFLYVSMSDAEDSGYLYPNGGLFDYSIAIVPTDNYTFEDQDFTFPQRGIYFIKNTYAGEDFLITSLAIPGYVFESGSDPITPDMISAAPKYHPSTAGNYGVGTRDDYGHLRLAKFDEIFTFDSENRLLDKDGERVEDWMEYLADYAAGADFVYYFYAIANLWFKALDEEITILNQQTQQLRSDVDALMGK